MDGPAGGAGDELSEAALRRWLREQLAGMLEVPAESLASGRRFRDLGLDSARATGLVARLAERLGRPLSPTLLWQQPTVEALARHLAGAGEMTAPAFAGTLRESRDEPIALVGMACRFPGGATSPEAFWQLLADGVDAITEMSGQRWDSAAFFDPDPAAPGKMSTRWGGFIEGVDRFDPSFFGISPREAVAMDPQQRHMLELSWEALEDAGIVPGELRGSATGVFFGAMWSDYARLAGGDPSRIALHTATGEDHSIIAARVSYQLGLEGPSLALNTACSSSLVAVHLACQSLWQGESDLALAGGVNLILAPHSTVAMTKFGAMAPDGRSKAFDARADGYVRGEGGGVVVLKPLSRALAARDPIYCVIRGGAVNNDGFSNGLTAPSPQAQEKVVAAACRRAGVEPGEVHYVETHGTGTLLGDPIEAGALGAVLGAGRKPERALRIGSVKTNLGHLEAAAGIAGLIKTALAIRQRTLVPSLHFETPNPNISFEDLRLSVQDRLEPWPHGRETPLAGISSFGFGGTNCHLILAGLGPHPVRLVPLAAASEEELAQLMAELGEIAGGLDGPTAFDGLALAAARHLSRGRCRIALVAKSPEDLREQLETQRQEMLTGEASRPRIVFLCSGQGGQWLGMGRTLLHEEPVFGAVLEDCDRALSELGGGSVLAELVATEASSRLAEVDVLQPVLFSIQVALGVLWRSWGIEPDAIIGQSLGEVSAACLAGILSLDDAMRVVFHRSRLARRTAGQGAMAVVSLAAEDAERALAEHCDQLAVAGENSPVSSVLSGEPRALEAVIARLEQRGVKVARVNVDCAYHSPQMEPLAAELRAALSGLAPRPGRVPMCSTVTGELIEGTACGADYWARNLRQRVRLAPAVRRLLAAGETLFVELGPHPVARRPLEEILAAGAWQGKALPSLRRGEDERAELLATLGVLYEHGADVVWDRLVSPGTAAYRLPEHLAPPAGGDAAPPDGAGEAPSEGAGRSAQLLPLSAKSEGSLRRLASELERRLEAPAASLAAICRAAGANRSHFDHRLAVVGESPAEMRSRLVAWRQDPGAAADSGDVAHRVASPAGGRPKMVFVFPGQGSQWRGMGRQLLATEPVFRTAVTACEASFRRFVDWSLLAELEGDSDLGWERIDVVQPALFAIQVALAALWREWGIHPDAVVGHSMGEVAAAQVSGALDLDDAARIICRRSRLLRRVSGRGAMAMVELSAAAARARLEGREDRVSAAVSNSHSSTVLSGDPETLREVIEELEGEHVFCRWVKVDVASHSPQMDPLRADLLAALAGIEPRAGEVPIYSTVSGEVSDGAGVGPAYWADNLRRPVRFAGAVEQLRAAGHRLFVEISPHPVLLPDVEQMLAGDGAGADGAGAAVPSLRRGQPERTTMLGSLGALYVSGCEADWRRLGSPVVAGDRREIVRSLPTYPWQRQRFWLEEPAAGDTRPRMEAVHPLLGHRLRSALEDQQFESLIDLRSSSFLADHRLRGTAVMPAAAFVEMALAAARESSGTWDLEEMIIGRALRLDDEGQHTVQLILSPEDGAGYRFQIFSLDDGREGSWTLHAGGRLRPRAGASASPERSQPSGATAEAAWPSLDAARERCRVPVPVAETYRDWRRRGLEYGPCFRGLESLWRGDDEVLGRVRLPAVLEQEEATDNLHACLLDACFQVLVAASTADSDEHVPLPVGIARVRWSGRGSDRAWCHLRPRAADDETFSGDLRIFDHDGAWLADVLGLECRRVRRADLLRVAGRSLDEWLFDTEWQTLIDPALEEPRAAGDMTPAGKADTWCILADQEGWGEALAKLLADRGQSPVLVVPGAAWERLDGRRYAVSPARPEDFHLLAAELRDSGCAGVVHLWGLDGEPAQGVELEKTGELSPVSVLHLVQALITADWPAPPRLWLVTRGAQTVAGAGQAVFPATLWGLGKVVALEHPELRTVLLDLDPGTDVPDAEILLRELRLQDPEEQVALRGGLRYVPRLTSSRPPSSGVSDSGGQGRVRFDPEGSYLMTGGLGGLGLAVAGWMVERGARRLVLVGRRGASGAAREKLGQMEAAGAEIEVARADVANRQQLASVLDRIRRSASPLLGVVHAAGVLDDGILLEQDAARFAGVMAPKVRGSWNLHLLTRDDPLDFFVLFSSIASFLGSPGQGSYAAANAFLDALAHHRRAAGLPASSINWGPWAEVGLAA